MKHILFLITFTFLLAGSCKKDASVDTTSVASELKCKSLDKFKWKSIDEMVDKIHWIQQSCFRIEGPKCKIYTDPLSITQADVADLILITHSHDDHFSPADIDKIAGPNTIIIAPEDCNYTGKYAKRVVLLPGEEFTVNRHIKIKAVPAYNVTKTYFHPKSSNWVGYLITINGVTVYHAGDTERIPEMKNFTCDIAMLPLGQVYTMNSVADAAESAKDVKARVAIPMHFDLYEGTIEDASTFKNLLEGSVKVVIKTRGQ
jgi:L-ascorbate metabolism protein UlaG (beta-lactamase superfamily)